MHNRRVDRLTVVVRTMVWIFRVLKNQQVSTVSAAAAHRIVRVIEICTNLPQHYGEILVMRHD